jgi:hypothetical protein
MEPFPAIARCRTVLLVPAFHGAFTICCRKSNNGHNSNIRSSEWRDQNPHEK